MTFPTSGASSSGGGAERRDRARTRCRGALSAPTLGVRKSGVVVIAGLLAACTTVQATPEPLRVQMRNVDLHVTNDITLHVKELTGRFVPEDRTVPHLEYKHSYAVAIDAGEIAIDLASLNALMTRSSAGSSRRDASRSAPSGASCWCIF